MLSQLISGEESEWCCSELMPVTYRQGEKAKAKENACVANKRQDPHGEL